MAYLINRRAKNTKKQVLEQVKLKRNNETHKNLIIKISFGLHDEKAKGKS